MARLNRASGFGEPLPGSWSSRCCKTFAFVFPPSLSVPLHLPIPFFSSFLSFPSLSQALPVNSQYADLFKAEVIIISYLSLVFLWESLCVLQECQWYPASIVNATCPGLQMRKCIAESWSNFPQIMQWVSQLGRCTSEERNYSLPNHKAILHFLLDQKAYNCSLWKPVQLSLQLTGDLCNHWFSMCWMCCAVEGIASAQQGSLKTIGMGIDQLGCKICLPTVIKTDTNEFNWTIRISYSF